MKRLALGLLICLFLVPPTAAAAADGSSGSGVASDTPVGAALGDFSTACPEMSDSLYRLYTAYFLREPDPDGWSYWYETYGSKVNSNLEVVSASFADSDEFRDTYGTLSNADFVTLVYNNVMGREPDGPGFTHWTTTLDNGYPRGSVMIAFSESAEYVDLTGTLPPMAGELVWYDRYLIFECDISSPSPLEVPVPTGIPTPYVDVILFNSTDVTLSAEIFYFDGITGTYYDGAEIPVDHYFYSFNVPVPDGITDIVVTSDSTSRDVSLGYSVVFYDHPHSDDRVGW